MWHINGSFLRGALGHHGANHRIAKRKNGFSHPARFELLEGRLPLNAAGGTVSSANPTSGTAALPLGNPIQFGAPTPGGQFGGETTLVGMTLPGTGNPTSSPTAGVFGGELSSSQVPPYDTTAFNNPSWVPQDRPPFPITAQPENGLPGNVNQVAGTPFGIRNFLIGADTSVAHGNSARIGLGIPTVRRPTTTDTRTTELLEQPLDADLIAAKPRPKVSVAVEPTPESLAAEDEIAREVSSENNKSRDSAAPAVLADESLALAAPPGGAVGLGAVSPLDGAAVDETMAQRAAAYFQGADAALAEADPQQTSGDPQNASTALHAMAASLALGAAAIKDPQPQNDVSKSRRRSKKRTT